MLSCGVTLPLQPFIARFLAEHQIAPAQLTPNSYRILMCLCLMWKLKGYGPLTPHEIHHFYTLRQAGNSGTYFLLSLAVENWIPKGMANPGQVEISSDEKKKGFIWGFPTSNKMWKNSWFFVGGEWGRDVPANVSHNFSTKKVPKHFTSPKAWSRAIPVLLDVEIAHLAAAAVLPLDERVCDFDIVCDLQTRAVKNSEATSKRQATRLAKEGIVSPDGGDPLDGEDVGDGGVEPGQPTVRQEVTASTPTASTFSRKGKEKVGASGASDDITVFDANVPETPPDPVSDLTPKTGRGKRPAERTLDHTVRPPKQASRVVQYMVSSDEEGAGEPMVAEAPLAQTTTHSVPVAGGVDAVVPPPPPEGVDELNVPVSTPPRPIPSLVTAGESNISSTGRPRPSSHPGASASASGLGVAREAPPVGSTEAGEGFDYMSLLDFSAAEICSHLIHHDVYIGEGWEHVKGKSCNRKM
ncbi:hypothetical protein LWI29_000673 [Acer saccharum]|uniref:Uncharacterized protein n=1 Tax=Acer saccharum TaxID=4024 RepID=A0AA39SYK0_ACESA|nr:hypothetical protein LWI29_000673 [Acer saccharum]